MSDAKSASLIDAAADAMRIDVLTLFPEMFEALRVWVTGRAIARGLVQLTVWNPRDFADDVHRTVDDRPYGGGPGMIMMVEPLRRAISAAKCGTSREDQ